MSATVEKKKGTPDRHEQPLSLCKRGLRTEHRDCRGACRVYRLNGRFEGLKERSNGVNTTQSGERNLDGWNFNECSEWS